MSRLGYCLPCGERGEPVDATVVIDGDPMCNLCVRMAAKASAPVVPPQAEPEAQPEPIPPLATGCWRKLTREWQPFQVAEPEPMELPVETETLPKEIEPSVAGVIFVPKAWGSIRDVTTERVSFKDIPAVTQYRNPLQGRLGQHWADLCGSTPEKPVLRVKCLSIKHAGSMMSQLRGKARRMGRAIDLKRDGCVIYVWLVEMERYA